MTSSVSSSNQNRGIPTETDNSVVAQVNAENDNLNQQFEAIFRSIENQTKSLDDLAQSIEEQNQFDNKHHQYQIELLDQLVSNQIKANERHAAMNEQMELSNAYMQRSINLINGIARFFLSPFRRRPELPATPINLPIVPPPLLLTNSVAIQETTSTANHPPKENVNHSKIIRYALWISAPIRWLCHIIKAIICFLAQKMGLILRTSHRE